MKNYNSEYKDYSKYIAIMISTDRSIFNEKSAVRARMIEYSKLYKELHIIIFSTKKYELIEISENCNVYSTNSLSRFLYTFNAYKIGKGIMREIDNSDNVLITCQDPFETGFVGKRLIKLNKKAELLLQIHTDLFSPYFIKYSFLNKIRLYISKITLPYANTIRVVSNKIADSLIKNGIDENKIIVKPIDINADLIKNGIPSFNLHEKFSKFNKIILMVSRLEFEKNIEMALKAMKIVLQQFPDSGLIIVGSGGEMYNLKKLAYNLKIEASIVFVGWQTDLIPYYKGCDLFLNTSFYEGYGMTLKEAQIAECKIVSTDVGIAREIGAKIVDWDEGDIARGVIDVLK